MLIGKVLEIRAADNKIICAERTLEYDYLDSLEDPEWKAKQGHIAELMGKQAAYNIIMSESGNSNRKSYKEHINILCIMDTGNGAAFVFRNGKRAFSIPIPWLGHLVKQGWGKYVQLTKKGIIPTFPGL
ncbi:MAG: hypothetical protein P4L27_13880 [Ignavibacteriaceae bacterium]|nr:hypothetical protein [Ignavibacteriaceae bacterium]